VQLLLEWHELDHDPWPQGEEPIYRNGKLVGWTTTAAYGFTLGCHVSWGMGRKEKVQLEFVGMGGAGKGKGALLLYMLLKLLLFIVITDSE
jgi:glycine cleavage system aminomethyltransferase T